MSEIPIIAAVGHETDWTLIDHVADRRAPTPTAAAEMAVPVRSELVAALEITAGRLIGAESRLIDGGRRELRAAARALPRAEDLFAIARRTFDELSSRLGRALIANSRIHRSQFERAAARLSLANLSRLIERARERTTALSRQSRQAITRLFERAKARENSASKLLDALSYRKVLERGFALVSADGAPVRSAAAVATGTALDIEFHDGHVGATANSGGTPTKRKKPASAKERPIRLTSHGTRLGCGVIWRSAKSL